MKHELKLHTNILIFMMLAACSTEQQIEQTYIAEGGNYAVMLQLRSDKDQNLTGTVVSTEVGTGFNVQSVNKPISGSIEGDAINFNIIHPAGNSPATTPVSGLLTDNGLDLTFYAQGQATPLKFRTGSAEEYVQVVDKVFKEIGEFD